ncbi:MAG: hypothetical protein CMP22_01255 [Rickettsiales bacterium]|nr:hypothetical protein [Rickettsiales bacterium]
MYKVVTEANADKFIDNLVNNEPPSFEEYLSKKPKVVSFLTTGWGSKYGIDQEQLDKANEFAQAYSILASVDHILNRKKTTVGNVLKKGFSFALDIAFFPILYPTSLSFREMYNSYLTPSTQMQKSRTYGVNLMMGIGLNSSSSYKSREFKKAILDYLECSEEDLGTGKLVEQAKLKAATLVADNVGKAQKVSHPGTQEFRKKFF